MQTSQYMHGCKILRGCITGQDSLTITIGNPNAGQELVIFDASNLDGLESLRDALDALIAGQSARISDAAEPTGSELLTAAYLNQEA